MIDEKEIPEWTPKERRSANRIMLFVGMYTIGFALFLIITLAPSCPHRSPEYYLTEGDKLSANGDNIDAIKYYSKAIIDKPDYMQAYVNRATLWMKEDSFSRAILDYSKLIELKPSGDMYYMRGLAYWRSASDRDTLACNDWKKARDSYNHNKSWDCIRLYCKK